MRQPLSQGFTLVEIMIVVAILGLLIAIGVPGFLTARNKGRMNTEKANLKAVSDNISSYGVNEKQLPDDIVRLWPSNSTSAESSSYIRRQLLCPVRRVAYAISSATQLGSCTVHGTNPTELDLQS